MDTVYDWLNRVLVTCFVIMILTGLAMALNVFSHTEEKPQIDARCLNSLCEYPCKTGQRFVKNEGCYQ
jgi:hypothetical protein